MEPKTAQFITAQQSVAKTNQIKARQYMYMDTDAQNNPAAIKKLWIAGNSNCFMDKDNKPLENDPGNMALSMEGHLGNEIVTDLSGQLDVKGIKLKEKNPTFALDKQGFNYAFQTQKDNGKGQKTTTSVYTASLTDEKTPTQRASFVRMVNEADKSFINKIYTGDGRVVEMKFTADGKPPSHANIDLVADKTFNKQWQDLSTSAGQKAVSQALGAGADPNDQNASTTDEFEHFCQYINLSPEAILYRLGVGQKPASEAKNLKQVERYKARDAE